MQQELSHNQKLVHKLLKNSNKPLKAYSILFEIQKMGIKSPTQVYRALDKLIEIGKVHKIFIFPYNRNKDQYSSISKRKNSIYSPSY